MRVSWRGLSRVVRNDLLNIASADGPTKRSATAETGPNWAGCPIVRFRSESRSRQAPQQQRRMVGGHHRTTGGPGQGVDARLLCPAINQSASEAKLQRAPTWRRYRINHWATGK